MEFVHVATPNTESEMAVMVCLLDAYGIGHFVHNRGFGGLYPGLPIGQYNLRRIMVAKHQAQEAIELLSVFGSEPVEAEAEADVDETQPGGVGPDLRAEEK